MEPGGWLFEWSSLEEQIYEEGNKIKNIPDNLRLKQERKQKTRQTLEANVGKVIRKIVGKTKEDKIRNQSITPVKIEFL